MLSCYDQVVVNDPTTGAEVSGVDYYFVMQDGSKFKVFVYCIVDVRVKCFHF